MPKATLHEPNLTLNDLKPGDILLCPPGKLPEGWISQAIVLLTKGEVSHAAIYLGEIDGEPWIADACPSAMGSATLKVLLDAEPGCYVKRLRNTSDLSPVLDIVKKYADHQNPYPFFNLGLLGLLLLTKYFSKDKLKNRIFYKFALLVSLKLMEIVETNRHKGKKPMSCSQFVAQCFTEAGSEYDIKFNELIVQFIHGKKTKSTEHSESKKSVSLLDLEELDSTIKGDLGGKMVEKEILQDEHKIAIDFINFIGDKNISAAPTDEVSEEELMQVRNILLSCLPEIKTEHAYLSRQSDINQFSTKRNYFVTPDDLLINTKNIDQIGYITGNQPLAKNFFSLRSIYRTLRKIISFIKNLFSKEKQ